jgi:hypothetical protein
MMFQSSRRHYRFVILGFVLGSIFPSRTNSLNFPPAINNNKNKESSLVQPPPPSPVVKEERSVITSDDLAASKRRHTSQFQAKQNHPTTYDDSPAFKGPIVLERSSVSSSTSEFHTRLSHYYLQIDRPIPTEPPQPFSPGTTTTTSKMLETIADHLAYRDAPIDVKEVAESMEFFQRTRKRLLGAARQCSKRRNGPNSSTSTAAAAAASKNQKIQLLDCCAGHGFTGMLFAACYPNTVETILVDTLEPASHQRLKNILAEVCPWVEETVTFRAMTLQDFQKNQNNCDKEENNNDDDDNPLVVIATHACGDLTDQVLDIACTTLNAAGIAVMPCCYTGTANQSPYGIKRALGVSWAADIRRSLFLMDNGYHSDVCAIPAEITPMNRILTGELRK